MPHIHPRGQTPTNTPKKHTHRQGFQHCSSLHASHSTPKAVTYHEQPHYCRFMIGHSLGRMEGRLGRADSMVACSPCCALGWPHQRNHEPAKRGPRDPYATVRVGRPRHSATVFAHSTDHVRRSPCTRHRPRSDLKQRAHGSTRARAARPRPCPRPRPRVGSLADLVFGSIETLLEC